MSTMSMEVDGPRVGHKYNPHGAIDIDPSAKFITW